MVFKRLVDLKNDKVKFDIITKGSKECKSVTYGCIRFIDSYKFLSLGLDELVENYYNVDFEISMKGFLDKWLFKIKS